MAGKEKLNSNQLSEVSSESNLAHDVSVENSQSTAINPVSHKQKLDINEVKSKANIDSLLEVSTSLLKTVDVSQSAVDRTTRLVDDLVRGLLAGRIDHELRPSAQLLLSELSSLLSSRELELLKQGVLQTRKIPHDKAIQGVITSILRQSFDELRQESKSTIKLLNESKLVGVEDQKAKGNRDLLLIDDSNSDARLLGVLRDIGLELATFLERQESDGISELYDFYLSCKSQFIERTLQIRLSKIQLQISQSFLLQVAVAIFFDKLELVLHDYLASGTDYFLVSGKVWASRYSRSDYMPFLYDSIASLQSKAAWLFEDPKTVAKIASAQVQVKAAALQSDRKMDNLLLSQRKPLECILLEMRALFGIGLNNLVSNHGELALRLFERVLTCSADAIEHPEQKSVVLSQRLSRIRVHAYLSHAQAEVMDAEFKYSRVSLKDRSKFAADLFEKKSISIRNSIHKVKYELELLGLSGLPIDISGTRHDALEGLADWVHKVLGKEEFLLLYDLSRAIDKHREAHTYLCNYLAIILGFESWEGQKFQELNGKVRVSLQSGAETRSIWRSKDWNSYSESFIGDICRRISALTAYDRERFISVIPLMVSTCFEFEDFDLGFGLAVAHRHLFSQIIKLTPCTPDIELLFGVIDAEVRFRFGLFKVDSFTSQDSALSVLADNREKEFKGYFREIDRKRESRLSQAVEDLSNFQALSELSNYRESQILREGIQGQFVSQEIRMLTALARATKKKSLAKSIYSLVLLRVDRRLKLDSSDIDKFLNSKNQVVDSIESNNEIGSYLFRLEVESRALAAVQVLLDASFSCAMLQDEKGSRLLLQEALNNYSLVLPGLTKLITAIFAAQSLEEFRRRVENTIVILEEEALGGELSLMGTNSGAALGFLISHHKVTSLHRLFERFSLISSIVRRRIVPGRCKPLQRYVVAHRWARLQKRVFSSVVALNDGLTSS